MTKTLCASALLLLLLPLASPAQEPAAQRAGNWIGTWASSPMGEPVNSGQASPADSTYRDVVRISAGGPEIRVVLTNEFGARPLAIGAAHVALSAGPGGAIEPGSDHALTFAGQSSIVIANGALAVSDPVPMEVKPLSSLAVSVYLPEQPIGATTCHEDGQSTNFIAQGDTTSAATLASPRLIYSWCFVKGIDVSTGDQHAASIVAFGDSITDGWQSTRDADRRWPDILASRLQADPKLAHLSVLNEGIGGNRLLHDGAGPNALARFDRDVLSQDGVKYLIVLEGINDIGHVAQPRDPSDLITTPQLIFALSQLVARAHAHGIKVYGATLTPYIGAKYASPAGEQMREAENDWIRTSGVFDGVIDFDKITRDPNHPNMFAPAYDSGDHLHPNDAGYAAMGNAIDLSLFR
ncbi:MAG TPA: SGNH/GDSL hydrolase family protein [Acidobacteriaceae bacterium]|jgi:lysophospholipase L1-like esterase|nr:SGNH/GDSL hydrolase family protein [Acidobacteriaceae bacterium]